MGVDCFDPFYARQAKEANIRRLAGDRFRLVEADVCDAGAMRDLLAVARPRAVFHIAALAGVRPSIQEPARYAKVNIEGLVNVLEASREAGCRTVLFASSSSVYGCNTKVPFAEDDPVDEPISPYAATKRAGELICRTYGHLHGLAIGCLRYFTVYGEAQRPDLAISAFMRKIATDQTVPMFGDGTTSRDYTYIADIVAGTLAAHDRVAGHAEEGPAKDRDGFCRIWNLGGSKPIPLREMIEMIGRVVGRAPKIEQLPMQPGDVERTWADLTRSELELNWSPTTDFETGLDRQWRWLRENLEMYG